MTRSFVIAAATVVLAALSVTLLVTLERAGWMQHGAPTRGESVLLWAFAFIAGWTLMMGAMTFPTSTPFLNSVVRVGGNAAAGFAAAGLFAAWFVVGVLFCGVLWVAGGALSSLAPGGVERLAATTLIVAAAYQASPFARACQNFCAQPFAILARHWRGGGTWRVNAFRSGLSYGASCVGCCVPMIALMFLFGMSDVRWLFGLGVMMILVKDPVWGRWMEVPAVVLLASGGIAIATGWWQPDLASLRELCGV